MQSHMNFVGEDHFLTSVRTLALRDFWNRSEEIDLSRSIANDIYVKLATYRLLCLESLDGVTKLQRDQIYKLILRALEEIAYASPAIAKIVLDSNFGQVEMLRELGGNHLWPQYQEALRQGQKQLAFLMTEPQGGSNRSQWTTTCSKGEGGYVLNRVCT